MNEQFYEGGELIAEITDSHLIVHKREQQYEYRLDSITHQWIATHRSKSEHNVFFGLNGDRHNTTVAVTWADRTSAEQFRNAVLTALPRR